MNSNSKYQLLSQEALQNLVTLVCEALDKIVYAGHYSPFTVQVNLCENLDERYIMVDIGFVKPYTQKQASIATSLKSKITSDHETKTDYEYKIESYITKNILLDNRYGLEDDLDLSNVSRISVVIHDGTYNDSSVNTSTDVVCEHEHILSMITKHID